MLTYRTKEKYTNYSLTYRHTLFSPCLLITPPTFNNSCHLFSYINTNTQQLWFLGKNINKQQAIIIIWDLWHHRSRTRTRTNRNLTGINRRIVVGTSRCHCITRDTHGQNTRLCPSGSLIACLVLMGFRLPETWTRRGSLLWGLFYGSIDDNQFDVT